MTLIPVIILYEIVFVKKGEIKSITKSEKVFLAVLLMIMLTPVFIYSELIYQGFAQGSSKFGLTLYERSLTEFRVLVFYLSLLVLPLPGRLCILHYFEKSTSFISPVTTIFSIIFITLSVETIMPIELMY